MKVVKFSLVKIFLLICSICLVNTLFAAKLVIPVRGSVDDATPIAVVPFDYIGSNSSPYDFAEVLDSDLQSSGEFEPMQRQDMVVKPSQNELFNYSDWRLLGADVVVTGQLVETSPDNYNLIMSAFDTVRTTKLLTYSLPTNSRNFRASAHHLSDVVYEKLTGVKGVFSTRVAYINVIGGFNNKTFELIVSAKAPLMSPTWSPDGRQLAYVSFENENSEIFVQDLSTGSRRSVSSKEGINSSPAFSPDGKMLAMTLSGGTGNLDVYVMDLSSGNIRRVTDSRAIGAGQAQVYRVSKNGGTAKRVSFVGKYNARPRVSADGKNLAVVHADDGAYQIAMLNHNNGQILNLTSGSLDEAPSVSPNGRIVIYATTRNGKGVLATVAADGRSEPTYLPAVGDVREPAWSPFR